jgi:CBS domain-containing protein
LTLARRSALRVVPERWQDFEDERVLSAVLAAVEVIEGRRRALARKRRRRQADIRIESVPASVGDPGPESSRGQRAVVMRFAFDRGGERNDSIQTERGATMGTKIADVMTQRPLAVTAQTTVREAARLMGEEDVGSLPVVDEGKRLIGIVTDRDVAVRVVGRGLDSETTVVGDVASRDVVALTPDHDLDDALRLMAKEQVRRVPVVAQENQLVGMLAQADVAQVGKEKETGELVEAISQAPRGPRVAGSDADSAFEARRPESAAREEQRPERP